MEDFDKSIWNYLYANKLRCPMNITTGIKHLTPEESQEAYKNRKYFKKNQRGLTEQWKTYWAKKVIESYEERVTEEENEKNPETEYKKKHC